MSEEQTERVAKPSAYLKFWYDGDEPRYRVDLTDICERWLNNLSPTITPLYSLDEARHAIPEIESLSKRVAELEGLLTCMIETVKSTADEMPAPNDWTPRFMQIATSAESFLNRIRSTLGER